jgi:hypothetical protein
MVGEVKAISGRMISVEIRTNFFPPFDQVEPPPAWALQYPNGYTDDNPIPDLVTFLRVASVDAD